MKTMILALSMLLVINVKSYAADEKVAAAVLQSFEKSFSTASDVSWTKVRDFYKAEFVLDGQSLNVWYNTSGDLIALSRLLTINQLPIAAQISLKKDYNDYILANLFEVDNEEGNNYYAVVDNTKATLKLKTDGGGKWMVYEKQRK
jgi:hypothetical protein